MDPRRLFGTSGIRGVVTQDLSPDVCHRIGLAVGTALSRSATVCIATDTRTSRDIIKEAVVSGLLSCGVDVVDLGIIPTPALAFLTGNMGFAAGIMVTASHNPPEFNGIKLFGQDSLGYSQAQEADIENIYFKQQFRYGPKGTLTHAPHAKSRYVSFIKERLSQANLNRRLRVVVDPGNGAASRFATDIFIQMGIEALPINDEPNGLFPGRNPEPKEDTLQETVGFLRHNNADLAVCFDGDADRVVFCDQEGFLGFNEPIAFMSKLAVERTGKRKIATTVETGVLVDLAVKRLGAEVVRGRVGDVAVAGLARQLDAALGVEQVGVYIFPELGYYPDSIFASLFLLANVNDAGELREFSRSLPRLFFQKTKVPCPNQLKQSVMARVKDRADLFAPERINTLDGVRLEFPDSWMLIRASGTEPAIRVISESTSQAKTKELTSKGKELVQSLLEAHK